MMSTLMMHSSPQQQPQQQFLQRLQLQLQNHQQHLVIRKDIKTPSSVRRTDGSQIIFSDDAIDSRIKELATRGGPAGGVTTSRPVQNTETRKQLPNSQIFFPE